MRTRALTTTLFARLVLSDLFLHGIGGAKYDQVTDQIVRLFFGFEPPEFATVSATLRLPIALRSVRCIGSHAVGQRLRELAVSSRAIRRWQRRERRCRRSGSEIIADKRRWVRNAQDAAERTRTAPGIAAANEALQPFVAPLREQIERERDELQQQKRGDAILRSREYSFCLYPRQHFDKLLADPRCCSCARLSVSRDRSAEFMRRCSTSMRATSSAGARRSIESISAGVVGDFRFGRRLLRLQIADAGRAVAALDRFEVKLHVVGRVARQHAQQVAAQLFARRAAQPMPPPDFAERMHARVAPAVDRREPLLQLIALRSASSIAAIRSTGSDSSRKASSSELENRRS